MMDTDNAVVNLMLNQQVSQPDGHPAIADRYCRYGKSHKGGENMLQRVKELEGRMLTLITDVAILKDKVATREDMQSNKADLHKQLNAQTWKIIGSLAVAMLVAVLSKYLFS